MKTNRLQAGFARKRETDHIRTERTEAVSRYYTHWGKQTSKFENWTAPQYYELAEENLKKSKEKKDKEERLSQRREKLRELLESEKNIFQEQLESLRRRPKSRNLSNDVMEKIDTNFKTRQDEKRRLDLEAKLYGRLRHGVEDESLLYESKSNNQVLAKLNWLDKQIEDQVQREQEDKVSQERCLRMQEEIRKTEENHKQRQEIREKEIKEIRALQEKHVTELKDREQEAEYLKSEASSLQSSLSHISSEIKALEDNQIFFFENTPISNNLNRIKMTIRKRSEDFRKQLDSDISVLQRIRSVCNDESSISGLIDKWNHQRQGEMRNLSHIESMYESEAKVNLRQCEETWRQLNYERHLDLGNLLRDLKQKLGNKFYENQLRQKELLEIRATHLSSIENSNERLKLLIKENEESPRALVIETPRSVRSQPLKSFQKVSDTFTNLNLDCLSGDAEVETPPNSARSQTVSTPDSVQGPKFGRKKVAWM